VALGVLNVVDQRVDTREMFRKAVSGLGRTLVTSGVILLLFVGYQLWGTGINTARAQSSLKAELADGGFDAVPADLLSGNPVLATTANSSIPTEPVSTEPVPTAPSPTVAETTAAPATLAATTVPATAVPTTAAGPTAPPAPTAPPTTKFGRALVSRTKGKQLSLRSGEAIGQIVIPKISVNNVIVQGTSVEALKKGPGHYKTTPFPGEAGNAAIACHRTTYGAPCFRLDETVKGDPIFVARKNAQGEAQWFRYIIYSKVKVKPSQNEVLLAEAGRNTLTLTTCDPKYSAKMRLVVRAELDGPASESELIAVEQDPFAEEYQKQLDAKNGKIRPTTPAPATIAQPTVAAPIATTPAATTPAATTPSATTPAATTPVVTAPIATTAATAPATPDTTVFLVDPTSDPTLTDPTLTDPTLTDPTEEPAGSVIDEPSFDGERSLAKTYKVGFFNGTAPAWLNTLAWALVCGAIWLAAWFLAHRRNSIATRWAIYGAGFVLLFLPALYFCFENVSRLLPEAV
jgi:LPXTG-site transpeptidase (sortase) family protein